MLSFLSRHILLETTGGQNAGLSRPDFGDDDSFWHYYSNLATRHTATACFILQTVPLPPSSVPRSSGRRI